MSVLDHVHAGGVDCVIDDQRHHRTHGPADMDRQLQLLFDFRCAQQEIMSTVSLAGSSSSLVVSVVSSRAAPRCMIN